MAPRAKAKAAETAKKPSDIKLTLVETQPIEAHGKVLTRQERQSLILKHIHNMRVCRANTDAAKAALKAVKKIETAARNLYNGNSFSLKIADEALEREGMPRRQNAQYEAERHEVFEALGQATYVQPDLLASMPVEARDETYWGDLGYEYGLKGLEARAPKEMPERFLQTFLKRWGAAQEILAWALSDKGINPEKGTSAGGEGVVVDHNPDNELV